MSLWSHISSQFGRPSGLLGHLAGFIMSRRQSNVQRNAHAIDETALDKVLDVNSFQFWENQVESLKSLREQMSKKAVLVIVHQPRQPGATRRETELCGKDFSEKMKMAGFEIKRIGIQEAKPVPVVNIIGVNGQP